MSNSVVEIELSPAAGTRWHVFRDGAYLMTTCAPWQDAARLLIEHGHSPEAVLMMRAQGQVTQTGNLGAAAAGAPLPERPRRGRSKAKRSPKVPEWQWHGTELLHNGKVAGRIQRDGDNHWRWSTHLPDGSWSEGLTLDRAKAQAEEIAHAASRVDGYVIRSYRRGSRGSAGGAANASAGFLLGRASGEKPESPEVTQ